MCPVELEIGRQVLHDWAEISTLAANIYSCPTVHRYNFRSAWGISFIILPQRRKFYAVVPIDGWYAFATVWCPCMPGPVAIGRVASNEQVDRLICASTPGPFRFRFLPVALASRCL